MTRVAILLAALLATAQPQRDIVPAYLRTMGFLDSDISAINDGKPVAKNLPITDSLGVALLGAVRIESPADVYVQRFRNIESFERGDSVSQIAKFHNPPQIDDLKPLELEPAELRALSACRSGSCDLQLSEEMMNRLRGRDSNAMFRGILLDVLNGFRKNGNAALGVYNDQAVQTPVAADFKMLVNTMRLPADFPELTQYLHNYPKATLTKAEEFFYWSKVEFGLKPTVRLNHVTIYPLANRTDGIRYMIVIRQLYASHYFSTTLEVRVLVEDQTRPGKGFYLIDYSASRVPGFAGLAGSLLSPVVRSQARTTMEKYLASLPRILEK